MVLRDFIAKNKSEEEIIYYLLDAQDWYCIINKKNGKLNYKRYKTGFLTYIKCAVVYVDEEEISKSRIKNKDLAFYAVAPKPAIVYLIKSLEESNLDGVMFNDHYFMSLEELYEIYGHYLYKYLEHSVDFLKDIKDKNVKKLHYTRLFLMLPSFYILKFKSDDSFAAEKRQGKNNEIANTIFVFSSRNKAEKFIKEKNLDLEGITCDLIKDYKSFADVCKNLYNYILIDSNYFVSLNELLAVEKQVFSK